MGGNVGGNKGISPFISSFPSAAVLSGSPLTDSLSVLNWFQSVSGVPIKSKKTVLVKVLKVEAFQVVPKCAIQNEKCEGDFKNAVVDRSL